MLGNVGDEAALQALRERLALVNEEMWALVVAVGNLEAEAGGEIANRVRKHRQGCFLRSTDGIKPQPLPQGENYMRKAPASCLPSPARSFQPGPPGSLPCAGLAG